MTHYHQSTCHGCRYDYRGRCVLSEPSVYFTEGTALCLEAADALIVQAEAIAARAWAGWQSEYDRETARLARTADEPQETLGWRTLVEAVACIAFWALVVVAAIRVWRG